MMQRLVLALATAKPQGPPFARAAPFVGMGHDWYAAGEHYLANTPKVDPTKLERDVINSRLSAPQDTRSDDEKTQARRPRCAHCTAPRVLFQLRSLLCAHLAQPCAHRSTALRPGPCASSVLCAALRTFGPALRAPVLCAHRSTALRLRPCSSSVLCPAEPCAHRCSAHTAPALHTECPAPRSQDAALSVLDKKRFETLDTRFASIDGRFNGIDGRLDKILKELESVSASVSQSLKYLKSVDKYLKFSFVTYRWVKALTVSSSVTSLILTGLIKILTPARAFQTDLISLVGGVFALCFGMTFGDEKCYGDEKHADLGAIP